MSFRSKLLVLICIVSAIGVFAHRGLLDKRVEYYARAVVYVVIGIYAYHDITAAIILLCGVVISVVVSLVSSLVVGRVFSGVIGIPAYFFAVSFLFGFLWVFA